MTWDTHQQDTLLCPPYSWPLTVFSQLINQNKLLLCLLCLVCTSQLRVSLWINSLLRDGAGSLGREQGKKKMRLMCNAEFVCLFFCLWGDRGKWCSYHIWPDHRCIIPKLLLAGLISRLKENVLWLLPRQLSLEEFETFSEQCVMKPRGVKVVSITKCLWLLTLDSLII